MKFNRTNSKFMLNNLQLIAFDFDGIFTNDKVYVDENGLESVACSRADSLGLAILRAKIAEEQLKTRIIVVSTETNPVVLVRCEKLKLQAFTGVADKAQFVRYFAKENDLDLKFSLYAGNDLNDLAAMSLFGITFAPANAHPKIKKIATNNLKSFGGNGFVRELVETIAPDVFNL
jgi:3-deoxy-D-manno-octulosonate 8-phosphate phosphatase (KDO 8-P phosphatase)